MSESSKQNLDWMYTGPSALVNREDYLLGRSVDKSFQLLEESEKGNPAFSFANEVEKDLTPMSIFSQRTTGPVDVIRKIKEDPLYQIQKKEEESWKQLLKNPVKMKQLQQLADERSQSSSKSKKHKKKHKRRHSSSSDSDARPSSSSSRGKSKDDDLLNKLLSLRKNVEKDSSDDSDDDRRRKRRGDDRRSRDDSRPSSSSSYRDRGRDRRRDERPSFSSSNSYSKRSDNTSSSTSTSSRSTFKAPERPQKRPVVDEDEKEKRRREMMENAKWRDEQRTEKVNKYREQEKREEDEVRSNRDPDFIRKQLITVADTGSVEKRIKSNSYNIQRSKGVMNQNFARR